MLERLLRCGLLWVGVLCAPALAQQGLEARVNRAIERGVSWLLDHQSLDGGWNEHLGSYGSGASALALYALLESGLGPDHQAVLRAAAFLRSHPPSRTYSAACQLLALGELGRREDESRIEDLLDFLLASQRANGGFAYPEGEPDISNTQYAALGLRAASRYGVRVPVSALQELVGYVRGLQERDANGAPTGGYGYRGGGGATGSRTAAGVSLLLIAQEIAGESRARSLGLEEDIERGVGWLTRHFAPDHDPRNGGDAWDYYYLYGLERVGALRGLTHFGQHDWYAEGAEHLTSVQRPDGTWATRARGEPVPNTAFALLFLLRATAPSSGSGARSRPVYGSDDASLPLSLRAAGDDPMELWVSSFGDVPLHTLTWPGDEGRGLRVRRVDYLLPGADLFGDERVTAIGWRLRSGQALPGFQQPSFDDARWERAEGPFGTPGGVAAGVRSEWESSILCGRRSFMLRTEDLYAPTLVLTRAGARSSAPAPELEADYSCLFEEQPAFAARLDASAVDLFEGAAQNGSACLRVRPPGLSRPRVEGWRYRIRQRPVRAERRYLRFAWHQPVGGAIELSLLASDGRRVRYRAGERAPEREAIALASEPPRSWDVVTRDLWADFGGDAELVGMEVVAEGGEGVFLDSLWLAREPRSWSLLPRGERVPVEADAGRPPLRVWLNGTRVYAGGASTLSESELRLERPLRELLRDGQNVLAFEALRLGREDSVHLGLRDHGLVAQVDGTVLEAHAGERFATRLSLPRPGEYTFVARALVAPPGQPFETTLLDSAPLSVRVRAALDPELLLYAGDAARNLLPLAGSEARASSRRGGTHERALLDGYAATAWLCAANDAQPEVVVALGRGQRADRLLLSHPPESAARAQASLVRVSIDGDRELALLSMDPARDRKTVWEFGEMSSVRSLRIEILDAVGGALGRSAVGFGEVELQRGPRDG